MVPSERIELPISSLQVRRITTLLTGQKNPQAELTDGGRVHVRLGTPSPYEL